MDNTERLFKQISWTVFFIKQLCMYCVTGGEEWVSQCRCCWGPGPRGHQEEGRSRPRDKTDTVGPSHAANSATDADGSQSLTGVSHRHNLLYWCTSLYGDSHFMRSHVQHEVILFCVQLRKVSSIDRWLLRAFPKPIQQAVNYGSGPCFTNCV